MIENESTELVIQAMGLAIRVGPRLYMVYSTHTI